MNRFRRRWLQSGLILLGILGVIWISLEGQPRWSAIMALGTLLVVIGFLAERLVRGHEISGPGRILLLAGCGLVIGLLFAPATVMYMAIKTGLHGHGAEFSQAELSWFLERIPIWATAGLLAGAGTGFLSVGLKSGSQKEDGSKQTADKHVSVKGSQQKRDLPDSTI